jgi:hypothetical protein
MSLNETKNHFHTLFVTIHKFRKHFYPIWNKIWLQLFAPCRNRDTAQHTSTFKPLNHERSHFNRRKLVTWLMKRPTNYFRSCPTDGTTGTSIQNSVREIFRRTMYEWYFWFILHNTITDCMFLCHIFKYLHL